MALTTQERERVRYKADHLGYLSTAPAASISLGFPRANQPLFLVEMAMNLILPEAEPRVRSILTVMDGIECRLIEAQERMAASEVGEIKTNPREATMLEGEYRRWQGRLARILGVYPNPWDPSGGNLGGHTGANIPVAKV